MPKQPTSETPDAGQKQRQYQGWKLDLHRDICAAIKGPRVLTAATQTELRRLIDAAEAEPEPDINHSLFHCGSCGYEVDGPSHLDGNGDCDCCARRKRTDRR
jgi:hypothetical protein